MESALAYFDWVLSLTALGADDLTTERGAPNDVMSRVKLASRW
jgi:hypothetical protein